MLEALIITLVVLALSAFLESDNMGKIKGEAFWLPVVRKIAREEGISEALLAATVKRESNWDPNAINNTGGDAARGGAYGLAQVTLKTARALGYQGDPQGLLDPETNLRLAARLHKSNSQLLSSNGGLSQIEDVISRYNSGKAFANAPTYTKDVYVPGVKRALDQYRKDGLA